MKLEMVLFLNWLLLRGYIAKVTCHLTGYKFVENSIFPRCGLKKYNKVGYEFKVLAMLNHYCN